MLIHLKKCNDKRIKISFLFNSYFLLHFFTARYYFSDENIKKSYRSILLIDDKINLIEKDLIFLESDTENIIEYVEFKKDKKTNKYSFWKLLYNDN